MHARRVALLCQSPLEDEGISSISYAAYRLQAALLASPRLAGLEVRLIELPSGDVEGFVSQVEAFDPDIVGASVYVWSFPALIEVARRLRRARPETLLVLGGPSARPEMFDAPRFADARSCVDAMVVGEGEEVAVDIVAIAGRRREKLAEVAGLLLPAANGWRPTAPRTERAHPDHLPSPYQMGLVPHGRKGRLETFRGCPIGCTFCQVSSTDPICRVHSKEHLVRELGALRASEPNRVFLIDAAINLSPQAFRNLRDAEREVGLFQEQELLMEVFPSRLTRAHLDFLHHIRSCRIAIGIQSFTPSALAYLRRPFDERKFEQVARAVAGLDVSLELVMGLPFDDPRAFLEGVDRLIDRRFSVLISHCLVLPDTFRRPGMPEANLRFEEDTLRMISCAGWPEETLRETRARLDDRARELGGRIAAFSWEFFAPSGGHRVAPAGSPGRGQRSGEGPPPGGSSGSVEARPPGAVARLPRALERALEVAVEQASGGQWRLDRATLDEEALVARVKTPGGDLVVEARRAQPGARSYRELDGVAWSYRLVGDVPAEAVLRQFDRVIAELRLLMSRVLKR
ncbi:MAG: cobalamin B12-binding domain-containing protein [Deltaproteobacteria bacterium]|nr:cobalamin B12-binding domain-containing protein [Deltaproteobacteria bacterium]